MISQRYILLLRLLHYLPDRRSTGVRRCILLRMFVELGREQHLPNPTSALRIINDCLGSW